VRARLARIRARVVATDALFISLGVFAVVSVRAWRLEPLPVAAPPQRGGVAAGSLIDSAAVTATIDRIVDANPFRHDRSRPATRYRLAGATPAASDRPAAPRPFLPQFRIHGIAATQNGGGLAALSVNGRPAQIVAVGQTIEGLRLVRVKQGAATLSRADTTLVLYLPGATRPQ